MKNFIYFAVLYVVKSLISLTCQITFVKNKPIQTELLVDC